MPDPLVNKRPPTVRVFGSMLEPGRCDECGRWYYIGHGPAIFATVAGSPEEGKTKCMDCIERLTLKGGLDP